MAPLDNITALPEKVALSSSPSSLNPESSIVISVPDNPPEPQLVPEVWYTALAHCKVRVSVNFPSYRVAIDRLELVDSAIAAVGVVRLENLLDKVVGTGC